MSIRAEFTGVTVELVLNGRLDLAQKSGSIIKVLTQICVRKKYCITLDSRKKLKYVRKLRPVRVATCVFVHVCVNVYVYMVLCICVPTGVCTWLRG